MWADIAAVFTLIGLTAYVVLGGADFGAGFWDLTAGGAERGAPVRAMIKRAMAPVWEANHVWLIFVLVMLWTAFPEAFGSITSTLAVPLFLAALGIVLRGGAFALKGQAGTIGEERALGATFALSSVLVPFFLGAAAGAIAAGEVPVGNAEGDMWRSWTGALPVFVGLLAVATGAHLAAVFLGADSERLGEPELVHRFRARALGSGAAAGALAIAGLAIAHSEAPRIYDGLTSGAGLACGSASSRPAIRPPRRWRPSWPAGRWRRSRTCSRRS
jgi:cytochrome d ubiquinol oxidase subunit II